MSFPKKVSVALVALALTAGGVAVAAGVANATTGHTIPSHAASHGHHSHDSDSDSDSRREDLDGRPDPQGVGGPEAAASDITPAGVPVVGTAQAAAGATKALPSGPEGDGQSGGGY